MRFLAFSDNHASWQQTQQIIKMADGVDLLVCAGDFSHNGGFAETLLDKLVPLKLPLWLVAGNHESPKLMRQIVAKYDFIENIEGSLKIWDKIGFYGCSFAASQRDPQFWGGDPAEFDQLAAEVTSGKDLYETCVFVTHCPPSRCDIARGRRDGGSPVIRAFIKEQQPDLVLCGHIHRPSSREFYIGTSRIRNIATQPAVIEIN